jgi:hypothetical protein
MMAARFELPVWKVESYAHDRRAHRHRCQCCRKIVNAGEAVYMAKVQTKKTRVVHEACADVLTIGDFSHLDLMKLNAFNYQIACFGLNPYNHRDHAQIEAYRQQSGVRPDRL